MSRVLPILFNTDMVRAILDGRKTVTRRMIKYPPHPDMPDNHNYCRMPLWMNIGKGEYDFRTLHYMDVIEQSPFRQTRYFESLAPFDKGDILYVRETWTQIEDIPCWDKYYRDGLPIRPDEYIYKADNMKVDGILPEIKWHPSIHMPKGAARIWLKVMDVRVERLQEMLHGGTLKEGIHHCKCPDGFTWKTDTDIKNCYVSPIGAMQALWNSTIKKADLATYGWDANPWVWVIEFERCGKPTEEI